MTYTAMPIYLPSCFIEARGTTYQAALFVELFNYYFEGL